MKKPIILFFIAVFSICCIVPAVNSETSETPEEPTLENSPKAIKQLCEKGRVSAWKYDDRDKFVYNFSTSRPEAGSYVKYDFRNAEGEHIGYGHHSDQEYRLPDGSRASCVLNR